MATKGIHLILTYLIQYLKRNYLQFSNYLQQLYKYPLMTLSKANVAQQIELALDGERERTEDRIVLKC